MARARARLEAFGVRLQRLEVAPFGEGLAPAPAGRPLWWLSFHERGRAALASPQRAVALPPGRAVLISPNVVADAKPEGDARELSALFELVPSRSTSEPRSFDAPEILEPNPVRDGLARGLLEELHDGAAPTASQAARAQALIHLSVARALETAAERERPSSVPHDARSQLHSHFIRMFRRVLGRTPARHVQERRVANAADLLTGTGLSIDEIAERCGFANRYHFTRVFAQLKSHPPARFRALRGERAQGAGFDTTP